MLTNGQMLQVNLLGEPVKPGVSVITAVKNRREAFEEALPTWLAHPEIDEIVVVDWASDLSLLPLIEKFRDGRILLAEVTGQPKWILSHAFNLAARLCRGSLMLKLDADVKLLAGFFEKHKPGDDNFFCGNWRIRRNPNELHLNGILFLQRAALFRVNGYNEFIKFYGWDDSDLYQRLEMSGLRRADFDLDTLFHIPHGERTLFQEIPGRLEHIPEEEKSGFATFLNRCIGNNHGKWSTERSLMEFNIIRKDDHLLSCTAMGRDLNIITPEILAGCEKTAIRERLQLTGAEIPGHILAGLSLDELYTLYNLCFLGDGEQREATVRKFLLNKRTGRVE